MKIQIEEEIKEIKTANSKKGIELAKEITYNQICNFIGNYNFKVKYAPIDIDAVFYENLLVINKKLVSEIKKYIDILLIYSMYLHNINITQENYEQTVYSFLLNINIA